MSWALYGAAVGRTPWLLVRLTEEHAEHWAAETYYVPRDRA